MNTLVFITRFIWGVVFMLILAVATVVTIALQLLWEIVSAIWLVLIVGKVRKF